VYNREMPDRSPVRMFGTPQHDKPAIPWDEVQPRLHDAIVYWIVAGSAARPVWAVWLDDALWFSTGSSQLWRGMGASPEMSAHLEDGHDVVAVEGTHRRVEDGDELARFCDAYNAKYAWDMRPDALPGPVVVLEPARVLAFRAGRWQDARTDPFPLASSRFSFS
jgi:hypothetical protein